MKVKQLPDDFQVEEVTRIEPGTTGAFAFYRMEKVGWSTPDALATIRQRWRVEPRRIAIGGLKDRHAATVQYLTIFHGPKRILTQQRIHVHYLGQVPVAYASQDIVCNRFRLALRDLSEHDCEQAEARIREVKSGGVPNYFDDQRFSSVTGVGGQFIARLLVRGQFEEALRLALTGTYEFDRAAQKREKQLLTKHWGDWTTLKQRLPRGRIPPIDHLLLHPGDFRGAAARLRPELRSLYLSAYQSHLWNRILARWLESNLPADRLRRVALRLGTVPFHHDLDAEQLTTLSTLLLPLPSARLKLDAADPCRSIVEAVVAEEKMALHDLLVRGVRELFFSRGERLALCMPAAFGHTFAADDLHPGRRKLQLQFELPRGAYATLIVKALTS